MEYTMPTSKKFAGCTTTNQGCEMASPHCLGGPCTFHGPLESLLVVVGRDRQKEIRAKTPTAEIPIQKIPCPNPYGRDCLGNIGMVSSNPLTSRTMDTPCQPKRSLSGCTTTDQGCEMASPLPWGGRALSMAPLESVFVMAGRHCPNPNSRDAHQNPYSTDT